MVSCVPSDVQLEKIVLNIRKRFLNIEYKQMVSELINICFLRSPDPVKDLEHCLQQYNFPSEWVLISILSWPVPVKYFEHCLQRVLSPESVQICIFRLKALEKERDIDYSLGAKIGKAKISPVVGKILFESKLSTLFVDLDAGITLNKYNQPYQIDHHLYLFPLFVDLMAGVTLNKYNHLYQIDHHLYLFKYVFEYIAS